MLGLPRPPYGKPCLSALRVRFLLGAPRRGAREAPRRASCAGVGGGRARGCAGVPVCGARLEGPGPRSGRGGLRRSARHSARCRGRCGARRSIVFRHEARIGSAVSAGSCGAGNRPRSSAGRWPAGANDPDERVFAATARPRGFIRRSILQRSRRDAER